MTPTTELERLFGKSLSRIPTPEAPMPIEKSPDFGHEAQEIEHGGVINVTPQTLGDLDAVRKINEAKRKLRNTRRPRSGGDEPGAA